LAVRTQVCISEQSIFIINFIHRKFDSKYINQSINQSILFQALGPYEPTAFNIRPTNVPVLLASIRHYKLSHRIFIQQTVLPYKQQSRFYQTV